MNNPILNSESFDRAAYTLQRSLDNLGHGTFSDDVTRFERAVQRLATVLGMQAANSQQPENQPYTAQDFFIA